MNKVRSAAASFIKGFATPIVIRLGFEPKTHSLEGCCSIQLSYRTRPYVFAEKRRPSDRHYMSSDLLGSALKFGKITTEPLMKRSISCDRDDGELPIRDVRLEWTYAHEIRVCYGVSSAMVGMFFSYFLCFLFTFE